MKNFIKSEWFFLLLLIASAITGLYSAPMLPEQVPTHWNIRGQIDGYGQKEWLIYGFPLIAVGMYILMLVLPLIDPKKKNYELFKGTYRFIRGIILFYFIFIYSVVLAASLGYPVKVDKVIVISIGILFILLGNYMGRVRPNFFVGIKTPWTLSSEEVWRDTHRFAGITWVISGILTMITIFINPILAFGITIISAFLPIVYSYIVFKKKLRNIDKI